jgi:hypothetical protein
MEVSGQLHVRPRYPQGNSPWYPLDRRLGGPQSRSGRGGEEKNSKLLPELEPPIIQPVAQRYTTELSWLPYKIYTLISPVSATLCLEITPQKFQYISISYTP